MCSNGAVIVGPANSHKRISQLSLIINKMISMLKPSHLFLLLVPVLLLPLQGNAGNTRQDDSTAAVQQQLTNVEQQVEMQKQELEEERKKAAQLEKQVDCNYKLLNGYKDCEEKFDKTSQDYLDCTVQAKQVYNKCLTATTTQ